MRRLPTYDLQGIIVFCIHVLLYSTSLVIVFSGREFRAVFLSTSESTDKDGATHNPTKSICDPYVFNTVITRAQSLVVAVGNPLMLLRMEKHMVQKYGEKGKCWSNYLKVCLDNHTFNIHDSICVSEAEKSRYIQKLQMLVEKQLATSQPKPLTHISSPPICPSLPSTTSSIDSKFLYVCAWLLIFIESSIRHRRNLI